MFQSTKEFDEAICKILNSIRGGSEIPKANQMKLSESDYYDAINRINKLKLATGTDSFNQNPRITYEGLEYLEQHGHQ